MPCPDFHRDIIESSRQVIIINCQLLLKQYGYNMTISGWGDYDSGMWHIPEVANPVKPLG
jgi:hypothetical protein